MKPDWRHILISLLVGLVAGAALGRWTQGRCRWGSEHRYSRMVEHFSRNLDLSPEQRSEISALLEAKRGRIQALRAELRPRFEEIRASTKAEIRKILTPEQRERFERLEAQWASRWEKRRSQEKP